MSDAAAVTAPSAADPDATAWEDPPRRTSRTGPPVVRVEGFEGPLDWLLEMARAQKIDLARLPILALIGGFCAALEAALAEPRADLLRGGDWLILGASLLELRSRLLRIFDPVVTEAAADQAERLRRTLLDRDRLRAAGAWLGARPQLGREMFERGRPEVSARPAPAGDIAELLRACLVLLRVPGGAAPAYQPPRSRFWRVDDAMARIRQRLAAQPAGGPLGRFLPRIAADAEQRELRCRAAVAGTLMAGLELARLGDLRMRQEGPWGPIHLLGPDATGPTPAARDAACVDPSAL